MTQPASHAADPPAALQAMMGREHLRAAGAGDAVEGVAPRWVAEPGTAAELAQALSVADGAGWRVVARGGGTKLDWGAAPRALDLLISTRRLDRLLEHAAGDMTATVQAGCRVADFLRLLAERGQRLALDALWPQAATIGGIVAANDNGALRPAFGSLRDHLIGVTIALPDGTLARSGGKVVKNVAGYDLPKLIIGSLGTLGVITEATFRLYPLAHQAETLHLDCPPAAEVRVLEALGACAPLTTAVQMHVDGQGPARLLVLVEGLPEAMAGKIARLVQAAAEAGGGRRAPDADAWRSRELLFAVPDACVGKFGLPRSRWGDFLETMRTLPSAGGLRWKMVGEAYGMGLLQFSGAPAAQTVQSLMTVRSRLETFGGWFVLLRAPAEIKRQFSVWPEPGDALPLMRRVKEQFDPKGTLAPGRFVGGI